MTTLGKVAYILLILVCAGWVAVYGWFRAGSAGRQPRPSGAEGLLVWLASLRGPWAVRIVYILLAVLILVLGGFGVAGGFHL